MVQTVTAIAVNMVKKLSEIILIGRINKGITYAYFIYFVISHKLKSFLSRLTENLGLCPNSPTVGLYSWSELLARITV